MSNGIHKWRLHITIEADRYCDVLRILNSVDGVNGSVNSGSAMPHYTNADWHTAYKGDRSGWPEEAWAELESAEKEDAAPLPEAHEVGISLVQTQDALAMANDILKRHGLICVSPASGRPPFHSARNFHARVRKAIKEATP